MPASHGSAVVRSLDELTELVRRHRGLGPGPRWNERARPLRRTGR
ncbi:hypothetical protein [Streptomyces mutabilis]|nr:hypothetical protein [Streptomyces sp. Alain-F2R5]MDG9689869.1 hypothetical protein [Streptomyces sp. DH17]